ncbi:Zn(II)2Cys6 transcription factor domain-containing protein [Aspergillus lucknowensis]|uniref:Zn(2)-C6 fungal-type domain-containing protein n=1 Tax=Aspergillus lucknowensis TaxID=176173 RepID=A0ABR4M371_9EURO
MPGVPSSRGCEACRRQKKKCDQLKPACTRCTRLQIPCVGSGQRRFKFKEGYASKQQGAIILSTFARVPTNDTLQITRDFIEVLQVTDIRYDVTWYGPFLENIPCRIGSSAALDAAIAAVTGAVKALRTRQGFPDAMTKYVKGWKALRTCLSDPEQTKSIHTVVAIYLMMICQSWVGRPDDHFANHGEILAHILDAAVTQAGKGEFEDGMIVTLSSPVVLQSIVDPNLPLGSWFWTLAKSYEPKRPIMENQFGRLPSLQFYVMAQVTQWLRDPALHLVNIATAYNQLIADCSTMHSMLDKIVELEASGNPFLSGRLHTRPQAAYSVLICLALILNLVMRIFDPNSETLAEEAADLIGESIWLSRLADRHRPFGVSFMPVSLATAWMAADSMAVKDQIRDILIGYQADFPAMNWIETCSWLQNKYDEIRRSQLDALFATQF